MKLDYPNLYQQRLNSITPSCVNLLYWRDKKLEKIYLDENVKKIDYMWKDMDDGKSCSPIPRYQNNTTFDGGGICTIIQRRSLKCSRHGFYYFQVLILL